jgi:hypothetical protein
MSSEQAQDNLEFNSDHETIIYLLKQGIEVEKLHLEYLEMMQSDTLDSFVKIMKGERFLTMLISSGWPK